MNVKEDIEQALARPVCGGWDRDFLESILSQLETGRNLSPKQRTTVTQVVARNGEAAQLLHTEWETVFEKEHKEEALVLAHYYKTTGYFSELTRDILADTVPVMTAYIKMRGNNYASKVLETYHSPPKYDVGALVTSRASTLTTHIHADRSIAWAISHAAIKTFFAKGGFVLTTTSEIRSAAKGAKMYKILPIGSAIPLFVEERYIKHKRK